MFVSVIIVSHQLQATSSRGATVNADVDRRQVGRLREPDHTRNHPQFSDLMRQCAVQACQRLRLRSMVGGCRSDRGVQLASSPERECDDEGMGCGCECALSRSIRLVVSSMTVAHVLNRDNRSSGACGTGIVEVQIALCEFEILLT